MEYDVHGLPLCRPLERTPSLLETGPISKGRRSENRMVVIQVAGAHAGRRRRSSGTPVHAAAGHGDTAGQEQRQDTRRPRHGLHGRLGPGPLHRPEQLAAVEEPRFFDLLLRRVRHDPRRFVHGELDADAERLQRDALCLRILHQQQPQRDAPVVHFGRQRLGRFLHAGRLLHPVREHQSRIHDPRRQEIPPQHPRLRRRKQSVRNHQLEGSRSRDRQPEFLLSQRANLHRGAEHHLLPPCKP